MTGKSGQKRAERNSVKGEEAWKARRERRGVKGGETRKKRRGISVTRSTARRTSWRVNVERSSAKETAQRGKSRQLNNLILTGARKHHQNSLERKKKRKLDKANNRTFSSPRQEKHISRTISISFLCCWLFCLCPLLVSRLVFLCVL